ncbi:MAG: 50S ribosomal protein L32e [Candidatus Methanomethylophilaceae archaeon]|jgi:large subunit ribosomal protein L32e
MTVKTLTDLTGLKEVNVAELEQMGIKSVADLSKALEKEETVKEIIKELSGVGPKTVMKWQGQLKGAPAEAASKAEKSAEKKAEKVDKKAEKAEKKADKKAGKSEKSVKVDKSVEAKVEVMEEGADENVYVPKIKPVLDEETTDGLAKRAIISGRRPAFKRQEWFRYAKLGESWRRPKGIHSKMKRNLARRPPVVDIGFRGPASVRNLHPSGFEEVLVYNVEGLESIDPKIQAARIGGTVGTKKRITIEERAAELGIRVLNRMV